jgi:hypothetical protein
MEAVSRDFKGVRADLDDEDVKADDDNDNDIVDPVLVDVLEDVQVIIYHTSVENVEDCHNDKDVEHICHLSRSTPSIIVFRILWVPTEVLRLSRTDIWSVIAPETFIWLREKVLPTEADGIHDTHRVD